MKQKEQKRHTKLDRDYRDDDFERIQKKIQKLYLRPPPPVI